MSLFIYIGSAKKVNCEHYAGCFRVVDPDDNMDENMVIPGCFPDADAAIKAATSHAKAYLTLLAILGQIDPREIDTPFSPIANPN